MFRLKPSCKLHIPGSAREFDLLLTYEGLDFRLLHGSPDNVFISGNSHWRKPRPFTSKYPPEVKTLIEDHFRTVDIPRSHDSAEEVWRIHAPTITDYFALANFVVFGEDDPPYTNKRSNQKDRVDEMRELLLHFDKSVGPLTFHSVTTHWITLSIKNKIEFADYEKFVQQTLDYAYKHFEVCYEVAGRIKGWTRSGYKTQRLTIGAIYW